MRADGIERPIELLGPVIMPIEGVGATCGLARYIDAIADFKKAVRAGPLDSPEFNQNHADLENYYAEARGRRQGRKSAVIDYVSRHGDVVAECVNDFETPGLRN